jgi:catechol 2,3-dioxygenase-like lactoylglutathione lyase family enzyme
VIAAESGPVPGVHHIDLVVSSLERSLAWYRELLAPLGYTRVGEIAGEQGETVFYLGGSGGAAIGLREQRVEGAYDRYRLGIHHLAFVAPSRKVVDERHRWLVDEGATIENEPREYTYMPGYYATFFYDPDGIKLEILHVPDQRGEA